MTAGPGGISVRGLVRVPLPPREAFELFTPSGEMAWVNGWSPRFPVPVEEETAPGVVFETEQDGQRTTWIVAACEPGKTITYARMSPGDRAGLVSVDCRTTSGGATEVLVGYDLTALSDGAKAALARFAADYQQFLEQWERAIADALAHR